MCLGSTDDTILEYREEIEYGKDNFSIMTTVT